MNIHPKESLEKALLTECIESILHLEAIAKERHQADKYSPEAIQGLKDVLSSIRRCQDFFKDDPVS